jgi:uroporphyrinogen decarboxylase
MPLRHARELVHPDVGLQGNMDPRLLYAKADDIEAALEELIPFYCEHPEYIFNLGHGLLPDIPFENVKLVVDKIKSMKWE